MRAHRPRGRAIVRRSVERPATPRRDARRSRALDLHLRHDRAAEGRQRQSPAPVQWSFWFAGLMNTGARRPHVRLPADVSQRRRCRRHRRRPGARRLGADPRQIFRAAVLGRCRRLRLHAVPVYRRTVPLSAQRAGPSPRERAHRLRICCGNGLRADVWEKFQERFAIPRILEFYAATEGNVSLYNVEGKVGAIGRVPPFLAARFPLALVKFDDATGRTGARCRRLLHSLRDRSRPAKRSAGFAADAAQSGGDFEGYTERKDTAQKILRDVFAPGDCLVPHRRSDAHGRRRLFLFRRSDRRYLPLEGRERRHVRSRGRDHGVCRRPRSERLRRAGAGHRRRSRHGGDRHRRRVGSGGVPRASDANGCRPTPGRSSCASPTGSRRPRPSSTPRATCSATGSIRPPLPIRFTSMMRRSDAFVPLDSALYARLKAGDMRL